MAETTQEQATQENGNSRTVPTIEEILEFAQQNPGTPGAPVPHPETGEDSGWFYNTADQDETTVNVPRRRGSKFLPGHDAKMYKLNRLYLAGEVEINEHQRAYMKERGMSLDRKAFQKEQDAKLKEKEEKKQQAKADREAKAAQKAAEAKAAKEKQDTKEKI